MLLALRRSAVAQIGHVEPAGPRLSAAAAVEVQPLRASAHSAPPEIGYFPATPGPRPRVLYSRDVLNMTAHYEDPGGPLQAARSLSKALAFLHASNGCTEGEGQDIWRHLGEAVREWRLVDEAATRMVRWASCAFRSGCLKTIAAFSLEEAEWPCVGQLTPLLM